MNYDPAKNSEWEHRLEWLNKECYYCGKPMELIRENEVGTWVCLFCEHQEKEMGEK